MQGKNIILKLQAFCKENTGLVAVEFALIGPIFLLSLFLCVAGIKAQLNTIALEQILFEVASQAGNASGANFQGISQSVIATKARGLFTAQDIVITATHGNSLAGLSASPQKGAGSYGDSVCIVLVANIGMFTAILGDSNKEYKFSRTLCYVNEPEIGT